MFLLASFTIFRTVQRISPFVYFVIARTMPSLHTSCNEVKIDKKDLIGMAAKTAHTLYGRLASGGEKLLFDHRQPYLKLHILYVVIKVDFHIWGIRPFVAGRRQPLGNDSDL